MNSREYKRFWTRIVVFASFGAATFATLEIILVVALLRPDRPVLVQLLIDLFRFYHGK